MKKLYWLFVAVFAVFIILACLVGLGDTGLKDIQPSVPQNLRIVQ